MIICPFIPGEIPSSTMAMIVTVLQPKGVVLPELIQWLPVAALDQPIGNIGGIALADTTTTAVTALHFLTLNVLSPIATCPQSDKNVPEIA